MILKTWISWYIGKESSISINIIMVNNECKYPMIMQVLHLNSITLFKWPFTINVEFFAIPSFTWINM